MDYKKQNRMLVIFKALSNANRIKILRLINSSKNGMLTVNDISEKMEIGQSAVSNHLKLMRIQKIVSAKQEGTNMFYSIKDAFVQNLIVQMD